MPSILLIALLLRIVFSIFVVGWHAPPRGDEIDYHTIASNLAAGNGFVKPGGFPTASRPPVYPILLGAAYKIFGAQVGTGRFLQLILGVLVVYLVFLVAKQYFSEKVARIAAFLTAFNPFLIFVSAYLLTENLYMVLLLAFLVLFPSGRALWDPPKRIAWSALLLSLLTLTRPTGLLFGLWIFCALAFLSEGSIRPRLARIGLFALVWLIPFVPWTLRNHAHFGEWIYLTTHGGITFYQGNNSVVRDNPRYHGGVAPLDALPEYDRLEGRSEKERNREAWRMGKTFMKENPGDIPLMTWRKFVRFWRLKSEMGMSGVKSGWWWSRESFLGKLASSVDVGFAYAVVMIPLFLVGMIISLRSMRVLFFAYGVVAVHTLVALYFFGSIRGRIPIEPVIAVFAAVGLLWIIHEFRKAFAKED